MKLLTVVIPSYNSAAYLYRAVESLLPGRSDIEILIVNDGSTDATQEIAEGYQAMYQDTIRVIEQENQGHGDAVNTGIIPKTALWLFRSYSKSARKNWRDNITYCL